MKTDRKVSLALVPVGVLLFLILPRDAWSASMFISLAICSIVGSLVSQLLIRNHLKAFILSIGLVSLLFFIGILGVDIYLQGTGVTHEYLMWLPLIVVSVIQYGFAGTLVCYGIVGLVIDAVKKNHRKN